MNRLALNNEKTHFMVLTSSQLHRKHQNYGITLNTGHQQIYPSDSERLLGATISNDFTWNEHIAEMLKTLNLRINGLRKVSFAANFKCRKMLANGLVMSKLVYAIQVYGSASEYLIDILQVQQNEAARIVTRLGWTASTKTCLMQVSWLSIRQLVVFHSLLTVFKIHNSGHLTLKESRSPSITSQ